MPAPKVRWFVAVLTVMVALGVAAGLALSRARESAAGVPSGINPSGGVHMPSEDIYPGSDESFPSSYPSFSSSLRKLPMSDKSDNSAKSGEAIA